MDRNRNKQKLVPIDVHKARGQLQRLVDQGNLTSNAEGGAYKVAFLLFPGQFNPVHMAHLAALDAAAREVRVRSGLTVIAGFLAPCSDQNLEVETDCAIVLGLPERCTMCAAVCAESDWLAVCSWGWASPSRISERIQRELADQLTWTGGLRWEFESWYLTDDFAELKPLIKQQCLPLVCVAPSASDPVVASAFDVTPMGPRGGRPTSTAWRARRFQPAAFLHRLPEGQSADCSKIRFLASIGQWERLKSLGWLDDQVLYRLQQHGTVCSGEQAEPLPAPDEPAISLNEETELLDSHANLVQPTVTATSDNWDDRQPGRVHRTNGDAAKANQAKGKKIVAHVCNDQGNGGRGFFQAIKKQWGQNPSRAYFEWHRDRADNDFRLGACQFVQVSPLVEVANLIGKKGVKGKPQRFDAIEEALETLGQHAASMGASVHIPFSCCSPWDNFKPLLTAMALKFYLQVYVYAE